MSRSVAVIGGGIVGLSCAEALLGKGFAVTVIDDDAAGQGCSYGNGGIVVPSHVVPIASPGMLKKGLTMMLDRSSPFGLGRLPNLEMASWIAKFLKAANRSQVERAAPLLCAMNLASRRHFERLIGKVDAEVGYAQRGSLMICRTEEALKEEVELGEYAEKLGLEVRTLSKDDLIQAEPDLQVQAAGAVHYEDDAHLSPSAFMAALRHHLCESGVRFINTRLASLKASARKVGAAETGAGPVTADEFVIAAGTWSGRVAKSLGLKLPLLAGKGFGFTLSEAPSRPRLPAILTEARVAVTPMPEGVHFVGVMELAPPPDRGDARATAVPSKEPRLLGMRRRILDYYPSYSSALDKALESPGAVWYGYRPCTPDGLPYVGRSSKFENVAIAAGHAMMGLSLGPITGSLIASLIAGDKPEIEIGALSPDRYDRN